jgi:serine/threonine protein kinase
MSSQVRKLSGQIINNYELRELYGVGGMGAVYRAYQRNLERDVAVKVMALLFAEDPEFKKRFYREAKLAAALEHPHIVPIYDFGTTADFQYVVMRLLTGGSLAERIVQRQGQHPSLGEIAIVIKQLASALDYAHSQGIIHRDVKSGNVMFDQHGTAYLVDFGIAKLLLDTNTRLTMDGHTVGTPTHMAPEQWMGEAPTPASDQYALGILAYELLVGRTPFVGDNPYTLMTKHVNEIPAPPASLDPRLPTELTPIIQRVLAKNRHERYPTATAFAQALEEAARRQPGIPSQMFTFDLRRDLLMTDVYADLQSQAVPPPQHTAPRPLPARSADDLATRHLSEEATAPSQRVALPPAQPQPLPAVRPPAQPQPIPAVRPPSQPRRAPAPKMRPPQPALAPQPAPVIVIQAGDEKPKRAASNFIIGGIWGGVRFIFKSIFAAVLWLVRTILRSAIAFIISLLLSIVFFLLFGWFTVTLFQHDLQLNAALAAMGAQIEAWLAQMRGGA